MTAMSLDEFNLLPAQSAASALSPCLDVPRWIDEIVVGRPYADIDALVSAAERAADPLTRAEVDGALAHHPRIGERAQAGSREAELSRNEQAGLTIDDAIQERLAAGNAEYERRFDRVFLIRAAGRSAEQILEQLNLRLDNDDEIEAAIVAQQLREIAVLRLTGAVCA